MELCVVLNKMVREGLIEKKKLFAQRLEVTTKEPCVYLEKSVPGRGSSQLKDSEVELCLDVQGTRMRPEWLEIIE